MFASCPGDPFFDNTMKFDFLFSFWVVDVRAKRGDPKSLIKFYRTHTTTNNNNTKISIYI